MSDTKFTFDREERKVVMERVFHASPERLWKMMTDPDLIPEWWGPERHLTRVDEMDVRVGGSWRFVSHDKEGNEHAFNGIYKEVDPPRRLMQTFNYEPIGPGHESIETAVLEEVGKGKTRLTMTSVYNTVEDFDGTIASGMESGARETWQRLASLAEKQLIITRVFDASIERVWQAWSEPQQIEKWLGPEGFSTRVEAHDFTEGGHWRYVLIGPDGAEYPSVGIYKEIIPHKKIVSTDEFGEDYEPPESSDLPQGMVTTTLFEDQGGKTKLTILISHPTVEDRIKHEEMGVISGWNSTLDNLEALLIIKSPEIG